MEKSYKFRIYPNKTQTALIHKTFGCARFVYNYYLEKKIKLYKENKENLTFNKCCADLTNLKKELTWLKDVDKCSLQNALKDLDNAYKNFYKDNAEYPKFKSKKNNYKAYRSSCSYDKFGHQCIAVTDKHIKLPKLGYVKYRDKRLPQGRIVNATISQTPSGKYFCSICCINVPKTASPKTSGVIGIDLGIKDFAITSNGDKIGNPRYLEKSLKKLAKLQRELARKSIGSSNRNKARIKVARLHEHIANQRKDFLQKLSSKIIKENDIICLEDLQVANMLKNHNLARCITDVSWSEFVRLLHYKSDWNDKNVVKIDKFYPSSQLCSNCGYKNAEVKNLSVRYWTCPNCGENHDRDINASKNILKEGLRVLSIV